MHTTEDLIRYYEKHHDEDIRLVSKHGTVEYVTTMQYIDKYLQPGMRIMEIGAGTGRYSHALAQRGYSVDAVELVESNIEIFKQNTMAGECITITQGDARDLSAYPSNAYDITLLLGSMYHLFTDEDKLQALSEAIRITKPGGIVFAAYCMSGPRVLLRGFIGGEIHDLIQKAIIDPETFDTITNSSDIFAFLRKEAIDALRSHFDVTQLHFVATDGYTNHMKDTVDKMDDATYAVYLKYHLATCERQDMIGYSHHTVDIFRKA